MEGDDESSAFFARALELDPQLARAYSGMSPSHFNDWSCQAWVQWDEKERLAYEFAKRAADLDSGDAMVEIVLGRITLYRRRFDEAAEHVARALVLNPNDADVLAHSALCRAFLGDGASGVELATRAMRLNPVSGDWYIGAMTLSLFVMGRYEESVGFGARMPSRSLSTVRRFWRPHWHSWAIATARRRISGVSLSTSKRKSPSGRTPDPGEQLRWLLHVKIPSGGRKTSSASRRDCALQV